MDDLQVFTNGIFGNVRVLMLAGEPWFVGKDIAAALGYSNTNKAVKDHVDDEDKGSFADLFGGNTPLPGQTILINESGIYSLLAASKMPQKKDFKHWVSNEVLRAVRPQPQPRERERGGGEPLNAEQREITRDDYIRAASIVGSCKNERLPIVLRLLENSGLSIPTLEEMTPFAAEPGGIARDTNGETARAINNAINEYGFTLTRIERMTGISKTEIGRIRTGRSRPKIARMKIICNAIRDEIQKIENGVAV